MFENGGTASFVQFDRGFDSGGGPFSSLEDFNNFVDQQSQLRDGTNIPQGIEEGQELLDAAPETTRAFMIVMTDGEIETDGDPTDAANEAREKGTILYAVGVPFNWRGVTKPPDGPTLLTIARDPNNVFDLTEFSQLEGTVGDIISESERSVPCPSTAASVTVEFNAVVVDASVDDTSGSATVGSDGSTVVFDISTLEDSAVGFTADTMGKVEAMLVVVLMLSLDTECSGNAGSINAGPNNVRSNFTGSCYACSNITVYCDARSNHAGSCISGAWDSRSIDVGTSPADSLYHSAIDPRPDNASTSDAGTDDLSVPDPRSGNLGPSHGCSFGPSHHRAGDPRSGNVSTSHAGSFCYPSAYRTRSYLRSGSSSCARRHLGTWACVNFSPCCTAATIAPTVTATPEATLTPITLAPGSSLAPVSTLAPGATLSPGATLTPVTAVAPGSTLAPGITLAPQATVAPAGGDPTTDAPSSAEEDEEEEEEAIPPPCVSLANRMRALLYVDPVMCQDPTPFTAAAGAASTLAVAGVLITTFTTLVGGAYGTGAGGTKRGGDFAESFTPIRAVSESEDGRGDRGIIEPDSDASSATGDISAAVFMGNFLLFVALLLAIFLIHVGLASGVEAFWVTEVGVINAMGIALYGINTICMAILAVSADKWEGTSQAKGVDTAVTIIQLVTVSALIIPIYVDTSFIMIGALKRKLSKKKESVEEIDEEERAFKSRYVRKSWARTWCTMLGKNFFAFLVDTKAAGIDAKSGRTRRPTAARTGPYPPLDSLGDGTDEPEGIQPRRPDDNAVGTVNTPLAVPPPRAEAAEKKANA
eukprot:g12056.t1